MVAIETKESVFVKVVRKDKHGDQFPQKYR